MKAPLALALILAAAACSSPGRSPAAGPPPQPPAEVTATLPTPTTPPSTPAPARPAVRIPARVAGFALAGRVDFEQPGAGSRFRYVAPDSLYADVFLYPGPDLGANCDLACAERVMGEEVTRFETLELPQTVRDGTVESFELLGRETLAPPSEAVWRMGRHSGLTLRYPERPGLYRSDYFLYYFPFYRVKVRVTYIETPARTQALEAFMRDLLPALVPPPGE